MAAGGGSRLFFRAGLFVVGPESASAHPGPVCYRKGKFMLTSRTERKNRWFAFFSFFYLVSLLAILNPGSDKENLFNNQKLLLLVIISFILMTLMFDSGVML